MLFIVISRTIKRLIIIVYNWILTFLINKVYNKSDIHRDLIREIETTIVSVHYSHNGIFLIFGQCAVFRDIKRFFKKIESNK